MLDPESPLFPEPHRSDPPPPPPAINSRDARSRSIVGVPGALNWRGGLAAPQGRMRRGVVTVDGTGSGREDAAVAAAVVAAAVVAAAAVVVVVVVVVVAAAAAAAVVAVAVVVAAAAAVVVAAVAGTAVVVAGTVVDTAAADFVAGKNASGMKPADCTGRTSAALEDASEKALADEPASGPGGARAVGAEKRMTPSVAGKERQEREAKVPGKAPQVPPRPCEKRKEEKAVVAASPRPSREESSRPECHRKLSPRFLPAPLMTDRCSRNSGNWGFLQVEEVDIKIPVPPRDKYSSTLVAGGRFPGAKRCCGIPLGRGVRLEDPPPPVAVLEGKTFEFDWEAAAAAAPPDEDVVEPLLEPDPLPRVVPELALFPPAAAPVLALPVPPLLLELLAIEDSMYWFSTWFTWATRRRPPPGHLPPASDSTLNPSSLQAPKCPSGLGGSPLSPPAVRPRLPGDRRSPQTPSSASPKTSRKVSSCWYSRQRNKVPVGGGGLLVRPQQAHAI
ncbi:hypothetical protein HWI79_3264 [Cryptosporidium felis]|nr:hypothetical protein HWI79_3264 [Cryptosporidium felis]